MRKPLLQKELMKVKGVAHKEKKRENEKTRKNNTNLTENT